MDTTEELNNQISEAHRDLVASQQRFQQLEAEKAAALVKQQLREVLRDTKHAVSVQRCRNLFKLQEIEDVNTDKTITNAFTAIPSTSSKFTHNTEATSFSSSVVKGEFVWKIEGMSWLPDTLEQREEYFTEAPEGPPFDVGGHKFTFLYAPSPGTISSHDREGSLVILTLKGGESTIALRYRVLIRRASGDDFVLWGAGKECLLKESEFDQQIFGPDVRPKFPGVGRSFGIFGLSHEQLLSSEWVHEDTLTVKFELELRTDSGPEIIKQVPTTDILPSTICADFLGLLDDDRFSDVTFIVQGQHIKAHSQVLVARSEYFFKLLSSGLKESVSKEVLVEDCDVASFKALLSFWYSDDFSHIEAMIKSQPPPGTEADLTPSLLLNVLSMSHRYQITRLQSWCEHKLAACLSVNSVCSALRQAHLFEAKQLEKRCYDFIKSNLQAVMTTPAYVKLFKECPEVALKVNLFSLGFSESTTASLLESQLKAASATGVGKRKREE